MARTTKEQLAEARAIYAAMRMGIISYNDAKRLTKPLLEVVNKTAGVIANRYGFKSKQITFQDLGRNL